MRQRILNSFNRIGQYTARVWRHSIKEDQVLTTLQQISQVLLLVLSVWVYFNQVVPIFAKERLEEEVARTQGELSQAKSRLEDLREALRSAQLSSSAMYIKLRTRLLLEFHTTITTECSAPPQVKFVEGLSFPANISLDHFKTCVNDSMKHLKELGGKDLSVDDIQRLAELTEAFIKSSSDAIYALEVRDRNNEEVITKAQKSAKVDAKYTKGSPWVGMAIAFEPKGFDQYLREKDQIRKELKEVVSKGMLELQAKFVEDL